MCHIPISCMGLTMQVKDMHVYTLWLIPLASMDVYAIITLNVYHLACCSSKRTYPTTCPSQTKALSRVVCGKTMNWRGIKHAALHFERFLGRLTVQSPSQ